MSKKIFRYEFKYQMDAETAHLIEKEILRRKMIPDGNSNAKNGEYFVTSLYFDSYDFSDYRDKAGGFARRKKIRVRGYQANIEDSDKIWLEIKNKFIQKNSKTRILLSRDEFEKFLRYGASALLEKQAEYGKANPKNEILWHFIKGSLKPQIIVRYKRKAFLNDLGNIRITFDSNLETCKRWVLGYNSPVIPVNKNIVIMEVKYSHLLPNWLKMIIQKYELKADTYSKYEKSLEVFHKYNPLLR